MSPISFYISLSFAVAIGILIDFPYSSGCRDDERNYLLDFKGGLNDSVDRLSSWHGYNCCEWKGIVCDYQTNHVIQLDLKNLNHKLDEYGLLSEKIHHKADDYEWYQVDRQLSGEIHPSLFNLQHLRHLDLSWNDFKGIAIPTQLGRLKRLTFLSLSHAGFGGEIPFELGNLSALQYLDLSGYYNDMKSSRFAEWVRSLRNLEYLAMKGVNLEMASYNWVDALSSLSKLGQIYLPHCSLSGSLPSLVNLTLLSHLHLQYNSFPFPIPAWLQNVSSLVSLDLSVCHLNGSIPSDFLQDSSSLTNLYLYGNSVQGVIPPSIANFSKLQILSLESNNLTGYIPPFGSRIGPPSSLSEINLSYNNLKGEIPSSLGRLSSLQHLALHNNQLNGYIQPSLGELSVLSHLFLYNNQLSGPIPNSFSQLVGLEVMSLFSNNLTGCISLSMFQNLTQLRVLQLSGNQLTVNISSSWVPQFSHLEGLGLSSCNIEGDFPEFLSTQYSLIYLDLSDNKIGGDVPVWLQDLSDLSVLNLSSNQLEGFLPLINYSKFEVVDLHNNSFHGPISALSFHGDILDLSHNKFNGSIPASIFPVFSLSLSTNNLNGGVPWFSMCRAINDFVILDLSNNRLRDVISTDLGRCSSLAVLNLAQNDFQGEMPEELGNLTELQTLNLNGNSLHGFIPSSIANCTNIQVFDIGNNRFQGSIPVWIGKMRKLQILSLTNNMLEGSFPPQLFELQNLQVLDLSHNNISGTIPKSLEKLNAMINQSQSFEMQLFHSQERVVDGDVPSIDVPTFVDQITLWIKGTTRPYPKIWRSFKVMDLSHNKLCGSIPQKMGLLQGLVALKISNNNISGSIPDSLGQMVSLESLDLSANMLSGKIPQELVSLTFLSVLNLSDNMLSGLIPQGKQFSTFEASSFLGNPKLRGPPLENRTQSSGFDERGRQAESNSTVVEDADADGDEMDRWWAVAVGLCFGVGFATVIAVLCFHIKWRYRCFAWLDALVVYFCER